MTLFEEVVPSDDDLLTLPMRGADGELRSYVIKPVSGRWWWKFAALKTVLQAQQLGDLVTAQQKDIDLASELNGLGSAGMRMLVLGEDNVTAMLADGVSGTDIQRAINTAFAWHASGGDSAEALRVWSGKVQTPSPSSASTAAAGTTKRPASGSSTTSRRKSPRG